MFSNRKNTLKCISPGAPIWRHNVASKRLRTSFFVIEKTDTSTSVSVRPPLAVGILISGYWYKCSGNLTNRLLKRWPPCAAVGSCSVHRPASASEASRRHLGRRDSIQQQQQKSGSSVAQEVSIQNPESSSCSIQCKLRSTG